MPKFMLIAIAATPIGARTCVAMAGFGAAKAKAKLLGRVLEPPHAIPWHDTFSTVFGTL